MKNKRYRLSLRTKIMMVCLLCIVIPVLAQGVYLTRLISRATLQQSVSMQQQTAMQLQTDLLNRLHQYYDTASDIAGNDNLREYLQYHGSDYEVYSFFAERIQQQISRAKYRNPEIEIRIYTDNTDLKFSSIFVRGTLAFAEKKDLAKNAVGSILWEPLLTENSAGERAVSFLMPIMDYRDPSEIGGVLQILVTAQALEPFLTGDQQGKNISLLTNSRAEAIAANVPLDASLTAFIPLASENAGKYVRYQGKQYLLVFQPISDSSIRLTGWQLTTLIPLDDVYRNTADIQRANITVCAMCILAAIPLVIFFSWTITRRLEYLAERMDEISHGSYDVHVTMPGGDEIAQMSRKFDQMLRALDRLTKQEMADKLRQQKLESAGRDARLLALESQINPHFLFNTLESIRMSLILKGDRETADLVQIFAKSFRVMIEDTRTMLPLGEELDFLQNYFRIQEFRFEGRIHLEVNVANTPDRTLIPKYLLQPLIENAIVHGLEPAGNGGIIRLSVTGGNGVMTITVRDNGAGMTEKELYDLRVSLKDGAPGVHNFAMRNIAERLRLLYGTSSCITIASRPGRGTMVCLRLPLENRKGDSYVSGADR